MAAMTQVAGSSFRPPYTIEQAEQDLHKASTTIHACSNALMLPTPNLAELSKRVHQMTSVFNTIRTLPTTTDASVKLMERTTMWQNHQNVLISMIHAALTKQFRARNQIVVYGRTSQYEFPQIRTARTSCVGASAAALSKFLTSPETEITSRSVDDLVKEGIRVHAKILDEQNPTQRELQEAFAQELLKQISAAITILNSNGGNIVLPITPSTQDLSGLIDILVDLRQKAGIPANEDDLRSYLQEISSQLVSHDTDLARFVPGLTKSRNYTLELRGSNPWDNEPHFQAMFFDLTSEAPIGLTLTTKGETIAIAFLSPTKIILFDSHGSQEYVHSPKAHAVIFSSIRSAAQFLAIRLPPEVSNANHFDKNRMIAQSFDKLAAKEDLSRPGVLEKITKEANDEVRRIIETAEKLASDRNVLNFSCYKPSGSVATTSTLMRLAPATPAPSSTLPIAVSTPASLGGRTTQILPPPPSLLATMGPLHQVPLAPSAPAKMGTSGIKDDSKAEQGPSPSTAAEANHAPLVAHFTGSTGTIHSPSQPRNLMSGSATSLSPQTE